MKTKEQKHKNSINKTWIEHCNDWCNEHATLSVVLSTIISALLVTIITFLPFYPANKIAKETSERADKEFSMLNASDIKVFTLYDFYVGTGKEMGRIDDVIDIPLVICNKGLGIAKDVAMTVTYNDGAGSDKTFNVNVPLLKGTETHPFPIFRQSILANSREAYLSKRNFFKMKIFLGWNDIFGKRQRNVELFKLTATPAYKDYPAKFAFDSLGFYRASNDAETFKKWSEEKIDF
ncbi:MAG: hypothetical protein PHX20_00880 [Candidatus Omnitrophica bacterium]|nr:hypothetical protein [Candidatus Omnitrophota bacterium]